mgnify:CR=1 FL=1
MWKTGVARKLAYFYNNAPVQSVYLGYPHVGNLVSQVPHLLSVQLLGGLHIVDLWVEHIGTGLREMLEAGQQAQVRIVGPASVVSRLDVRAEVFDLNGLTANALKAEESCEDLPHDNPFRPVPRRRGNLYAANFTSGKF